MRETARARDRDVERRSGVDKLSEQNIMLSVDFHPFPFEHEYVEKGRLENYYYQE